MPCRTGFEKTIAQRSGELFSSTASDDGLVDFVSKDSIRVTYKDGVTRSYEIGRRYGSWSGKTIPHNLVANVKLGDKVKRGDVLYYNSLFFELDPFSKGDVAMKFAALGRVAFSENADTLEDGSSISRAMSNQLSTDECKTKYIRVDFTDEVRSLLPVGTVVDDDSILCTLLPSTGEALKQYDEEAALAMRRVTSASPRAHFNGVIEQYRVYYCGDPSEMSPSLALLVENSDDELVAKARRLKEPLVDGSKRVGMRINGKPIAMNTAIIEVRMTGGLKMKAGDKLTVGGQMKSIVGQVFEEPLISKDGRAVDVNFSLAGIYNRMVISTLLMGAINTAILAADEKLVEIYDGKAG